MDEEWEIRYRIADTADYIVENHFQIVCAQLPDDLLAESARIVSSLKSACRSRGHEPEVYILADTTYNSLSVDEVAAAHINANCVVHYGRASMTKLSRIPAFFVFPQSSFNTHAAVAAITASDLIQSASAARPVVVFIDQPLLHQLPEFEAKLRESLSGSSSANESAQAGVVCADVAERQLQPEGISAAFRQCCRDATSNSGESNAEASCCASGDTAPNEAGNTSCCTSTTLPVTNNNGSSAEHSSQQGIYSAAGYTWRIDPSIRLSSCSFVWIGDLSAPALIQLQLTHNSSPWLLYDPTTGSTVDGLLPDVQKTLKRRYFLVEKARNAAMVGIIVGTLGVAGYKQAVDGLREAARRAGKRTYTLLMGKPSPAKLANFPEIEVFVLVADPQGQILDSKDYLAPIITPQEAMLAFTDQDWDQSKYSLELEVDGMSAFAPRDSTAEPRFSLLDSSYHTATADTNLENDNDIDEEDSGSTLENSDVSTALALHAQQALIVSQVPEGSSHLIQPKSAADYFINKRSWTGVEAPVVGAEAKKVEKASEGRTGRAAVYVDEPQKRQE